MRTSPVLPLLFVMSAALSACDHHTDSVARLNALPFGGTNEANIAAMVVNPTDLVRGHGGGPVDAAVTAMPIERLESDHEKPLLNPGKTSTGGGMGAGAGAGAGAGSGGGASGG